VSRLERVRPWVLDVVLAALVVAFTISAGTHIGAAEGDKALDAVGYACMVVAGASLVLRRRLPLTTVVIVSAALLTYMLAGYPGGPVYTTLYIALYSLATIRDRTLAFAAAAVSSGALLVVGLIVHTGTERLVHFIFVAWAAAAVLLGDAVRNRRERTAAVYERARQLEQTQEEESRRRVAEERVRIARDLHDSVAHSMATINVQAGAAAHVIDRHPDQAREALHVIEQASRDVLEELTAMLGLLREDGQQLDRAPTPGLAQVGSLVESVRRAGVDVTVHAERADHADVSPPVDVAAYRIVQESLTNVIRHAGTPTTAQVTIASNGDGGLTVEIIDDGRGANGSSAGGSGVGIVGMRERAEATGGRLDVGPRPGGGFAVRATWTGRT
jgi:signal transduction histidine kinase